MPGVRWRHKHTHVNATRFLVFVLWVVCVAAIGVLLYLRMISSLTASLKRGCIRSENPGVVATEGDPITAK